MAFKRGSAYEQPPEHPASSLPDDRVAITVAIRRLRFFKQDTGFFVADAEAEGPIQAPPGAITHQKGVASLTIKGVSPSMDEHKAGYSLRCYGRWVRDPSFGQQFEIDAIHEEIPATSEGLRKYLSAGRVKGIGPATASKIVDRWGLETLEVLNETPARLSEISGISLEKARSIGLAWQAKKASFSSVAFLGQHGIGEITAMKISDHFGSDGLEARLRADPYLLTQVDGVGFKTADQMALSLGFDVLDHRRMAAAIEHVLQEKTNQEGHTALPFEQWVTEAARYLNQSPAEVRPRCQKLVDDRKVVFRTIDRPIEQGGPVGETIPVPCISLPKVHAMERGIAQNLLRLREQQGALTPAERLRVMQALASPDCTLDPSQRAAVETALDDSFSILTGGPGTGKTTTLRTLVRIAKEVLGWTVELAAPTGRASKRMEDAIGQAAKTMHRQLEFHPDGGFRRTEKNPMVGSLFILDEVSMVDTSMAFAWLRAIPKGAKVLWVGDADQLPSVGPGDGAG